MSAWPDKPTSTTGWATIRLFADSLRILRPFWPLVSLMALMGAVTGLASATLVAKINQALHSEGSAAAQLFTSFVAMSVLTIAGEVLGGFASGRLTQHVMAFLRYDLTGKILDAPIIEIERHKSHRLLTILDIDVPTIGAFAMQSSGMAIAFAITAGCFCYLAILSLPLFVVALVGAVVGAVVQIAISRAGAAGFDSVREAHDELQKNYRAMIEGAKELRISRPRKLRTADHLGRAIERIRSGFNGTLQTYLLGKAVTSAVFFVTLLLVFIAGTVLSVQNSVLSGFVLALLYVKGPIEQLISALPLLASAQSSLRKVSQLSMDFIPEAESSPRSSEHAQIFRGGTVAMQGVRYEFPATEAGAGFMLGPVDLEIRSGETLFIVGGNGTGKTTLIKLLTGLYRPTDGHILCDNLWVDSASLDNYRSLFSVIFFDYFLFDDLVSARSAWREEAARYLDLLEISHKVFVEGDRFSTTDLSTGQRKRLALIQVLLEDRPIIVLDEWAADQDPTFRHVFYAQLLPELKRMGKTIIVVSHDDRYFDVADRIVIMEAGCFVDRVARHSAERSTIYGAMLAVAPDQGFIRRRGQESEA